MANATRIPSCARLVLVAGLVIGVAFSAVAGVKGGTVYGATDEFAFKAVEKPVHVHDLQATMLHLLGLDHTRLTYRHAGRDFGLTHVHGHVVTDWLA